MSDIISIIIASISLILTVILTPIMYNAFYYQVIEKQWDWLYTFQNQDSKYISKKIINVITIIYEKNGKPSKKRIFFITLILNFLYGVVLYINFPKYEIVSYSMYVLGMLIFISLGTYLMFFFQYLAYKININTLNNFSKNSNYIEFIYFIFRIVLKIFILPIIVVFILFSTNDEILKFLGTLIIYFSPLGPLGFLFNQFDAAIDNTYKYLLLIPFVSIFSPILFFLCIKLFHNKINRFLIKAIEEIDSFARKSLAKKRIEPESFDKIIFTLILVYELAFFYVLII